MVLRVLLTIVALGCLLIIALSKKNIIKYSLKIVVFVLISVLIYTFTTAYVTVKTVSNKTFTIDYIMSKFTNDDCSNGTTKSYVTKMDGSIDAFSNYKFSNYSVEKVPSDREVYETIYDSYFEDGYLCGLDVTDKVLFKMMTPMLTQKTIEDGLTFWFLPTLMQPYNPNSYLVKGCCYAENYYNVFAWYQGDCLNVVYERCNYNIGKTDEQHFVDFMEYISGKDNTGDGTMCSVEE
ncbi:MAG: hypothetical protein IJN68_02875 [Clostridia bacterium]|nr:hypothetical protein [Clostridia bacterium]